MKTILLAAGVVALMVAVIGGGLKALLPRPVRVALAGLGIALLIAAALVREHSRDRAAEVRRYQSQVQAMCKSVRQLNNRDLNAGPDGRLDRATMVAAVRDTLVAVNRRLKVALGKPAPDSLRDEAQIARRHADSWIRKSPSVVNAFADALPAHPTVGQIVGAGLSLVGRSAAISVPLEAALTRLSGRRCNLSA